mgnify:CR=1 FL=1
MYIVHINFKLYLHNNNGDITLSQDHNNATEYDNIGDAMRSAARINKDVGNIAKILRK